MHIPSSARSGKRVWILLCTILLSSALPAVAAGAEYVIKNVRYHIDGATQEWALANLVDIEVGQAFAGAEDLEAFIEDRRRVLNNQRTLQSSEITYSMSAGSDEIKAIDVEVSVVDTWNIIVIPYPTFDSNTGLTIKARFRDYNFLGTLEQLSVNLDILFPNSGSNALAFEPSFALPFQAGGYDWRWLFDASTTLEFGGYSRFGVATGLGLELPFLANTLDITYLQGINYDSDPDDLDGYFLSSNFAVGMNIDTGLDVPFSGDLEYKPEVGFRVNYRFAEISFERRGFRPYFEHSLVSERVDWIDNLRNGFDASVTNRFIYNIATARFSPEIEAELRGFLGIAPPFGFSGRIVAFYNFQSQPGLHNIRQNAGDEIRGVLNRRMSGDLGLYLNSDITLVVFTIPEFVEAQGGLFFDVGYVRDTSTPYNPEEDVRLGMGLEGIVFPLFARSLFLRLSVGFDPILVSKTGSLFDGDNPEIFFGIGHHY